MSTIRISSVIILILCLFLSCSDDDDDEQRDVLINTTWEHIDEADNIARLQFKSENQLMWEFRGSSTNTTPSKGVYEGIFPFYQLKIYHNNEILKYDAFVNDNTIKLFYEDGRLVHTLTKK